MEEILKRKRIFVVEDDENNMGVITAILRQQGATVLQDSWNSHTVELLSDYMPVDIVLLDLMLRGGASGYDIFAAIKSQPTLAQLPVVAVSASDGAVEIPRAKALGFGGFIGKPISLHRFPQQVLDCINGRPQWLSES
jgi:CheY-like chemotaxis protein